MANAIPLALTPNRLAGISTPVAPHRTPTSQIGTPTVLGIAGLGELFR
jgi:hypothetical protein